MNTNTQTKERKCKAPGCTDQHKTRGLCEKHYLQARRLVKIGVTTWEALEAAGKVDKVGANTLEFKNWLLGKTERKRRKRRSQATATTNELPGVQQTTQPS